MQRDRNNITKESAVSEKGEPIKGRGDTPNQHDILTGSDSLGRAFTGEPDMTCANWTSGAAGSGGAMVGHHDRVGGGNTSWNSVHRSRGGCSPGESDQHRRGRFSLLFRGQLRRLGVEGRYRTTR